MKQQPPPIFSPQVEYLPTGAPPFLELNEGVFINLAHIVGIWKTGTGIKLTYASAPADPLEYPLTVADQTRVLQTLRAFGHPLGILK